MLPSIDLYPSTNEYPSGYDVFSDLIFDRTQADVSYRNTVKDKIKNGTASTREITAWNGGLKGAYNASDFRRVNYALGETKRLCDAMGISFSYPYAVSTAWDITDVPTSTDVQHYLANIATAKEAFPLIRITMPTVIKNVDDANAIEKILFEIKEILDNTESMFRYADADIYVGGVY